METRHPLGSLLPLFACACVVGVLRPAAAAPIGKAAEARALPAAVVPKTPPPLPPNALAAGLTMKEVAQTCEAELSILCSAFPASIGEAKACLAPRVAAVRSRCRKLLALPKP